MGTTEAFHLWRLRDGEGVHRVPPTHDASSAREHQWRSGSSSEI